MINRERRIATRCKVCASYITAAADRAALRRRTGGCRRRSRGSFRRRVPHLAVEELQRSASDARNAPTTRVCIRSAMTSAARMAPSSQTAVRAVSPACALVVTLRRPIQDVSLFLSPLFLVGTRIASDHPCPRIVRAACEPRRWRYHPLHGLIGVWLKGTRKIDAVIPLLKENSCQARRSRTHDVGTRATAIGGTEIHLDRGERLAE